MLSFNDSYKQVFLDEKQLDLSTTQYEILKYISTQNKLVSTAEIRSKLALYDNYDSLNSIAKQIQRINKYNLIINKRGIGYRLRENIEVNYDK